MAKRLGATHSFTRQSSEDHKVRIISSSQKKKLSRLSLPKNNLKMTSAQLPSDKDEGQSSGGMKFIAKRKLLGTFSENKFT